MSHEILDPDDVRQRLAAYRESEENNIVAYNMDLLACDLIILAKLSGVGEEFFAELRKRWPNVIMHFPGRTN